MEKINPEVLKELGRTCGAHCCHTPDNCKCFGVDPQILVDDLGFSLEEAKEEVFYNREECAHFETTTRCYGTTRNKANLIIDELCEEYFSKEEKEQFVNAMILDNNFINKIGLTIAIRKAFGETTRVPEKRKQFVYLLHSEHGIKIGATKSPEKRSSMIGTQMPFKVTKTDVFEVEDMYIAEKLLHKRFKDVRINGEWFNLTEAQVKEIHASLKSTGQ